MLLETAKAALACFTPPPALLVWQWAELRRKISREVTAKAGRYSVDFAPYQKEPQESFTAGEVQKTGLYWAKRLGKTELFNNLIGAVVEQDPYNILVVKPSLEDSRKFSSQFLVPMIDSTPELSRLFSKAKSRDSNNTILRKKFLGGTISMIGPNAPSAFKQVQAPIVICDEIDAMEPSPFGDPVERAFGRADNYKHSILVCASTATFLETSRIHKLYEGSDQRKWFVKCPGCGNFHVMAWVNLKWPKKKREDGTKEHLTKEAYYECPDCALHWDDKTRLAAIRSGEWRPTAPFKGIRGYWLNGLNSPFDAMKGYVSKMHQFAAEHVEAVRNGHAAVLVWKNEFLCEPEQIISEKIESEPLLERREDYGPNKLPEEIILVGCSVDVQGDRLEYELIGLGLDDETWGIEYGKHIGNPERGQVWDDLSATLKRKFTRTDGVELGVDFAVIDHRHKGQAVRKFMKGCGHPRVYLVYGVARSHQSLLVIPHKSKLYRCYLFSVNGDIGKDTLFASLKLKDHGPQFMHFPKGHGYDDSGYFKQLTAERKVPRYVKGFLTHDYVKDAGARNEAIDLRVYFLAGLDIRLRNRAQLKQMAADLKTTQREYQLRPFPETPQPKPQPQVQRRRINMAPGLDELLSR